MSFVGVMFASAVLLAGLPTAASAAPNELPTDTKQRITVYVQNTTTRSLALEAAQSGAVTIPNLVLLAPAFEENQSPIALGPGESGWINLWTQPRVEEKHGVFLTLRYHDVASPSNKVTLYATLNWGLGCGTRAESRWREAPHIGIPDGIHKISVSSGLDSILLYKIQDSTLEGAIKIIEANPAPVQRPPLALERDYPPAQTQPIKFTDLSQPSHWSFLPNAAPMPVCSPIGDYRSCATSTPVHQPAPDPFP